MENFKKVIGVIVLCCLLAGSICGIIYGVMYTNLANSEVVTSNSELVSKMDNMQAELDALNYQCNYYVETLDSLNAENDANRALVAELETTKAELETQADADAQTIADLQSQVDSLNATITANEETIASLEAEIDELEVEIAGYKMEILRMAISAESYTSNITATEEEYSEYASRNWGLGGPIYHVFTQVNHVTRKVTILSKSIDSANEEILHVVSFVISGTSSLSDLTFADVYDYMLEASSNDPFSVSMYEYYGYNTTGTLHESLATSEMTFAVTHDVTLTSGVYSLQTRGFAVVKDKNANVIGMFGLQSAEVTGLTSEELETAKTTCAEQLYSNAVERATFYV